MASSNTASNTAYAGEQSYEKMDVSHVGRHCDMEFCHMLDFLPTRCLSCGGTFCGDHAQETAHKCAKAGTWARNRSGIHSSTNGASSPKPSVLTHDQQCADPSCKTLIYTSLDVGVHCQTCNRHYCLKHRFQEDHDCKNLEPLGARPTNVLQAQRDRGRTALLRLKAWADGKKEEDIRSMMRSKSSSIFASKKTAAANAARDRITQLKKTAKGKASIPQDKRVYLFVEASADTTKAKHPSGTYFYDKAEIVGRVLDKAADSLQVENRNNRGGGEEEKLRVFHVEGGRLLRFQEKIGEACVTGNMIVLLRGVGDPDLIDLKD